VGHRHQHQPVPPALAHDQCCGNVLERGAEGHAGAEIASRIAAEAMNLCTRRCDIGSRLWRPLRNCLNNIRFIVETLILSES
jgi:hypothetical protein